MPLQFMFDVGAALKQVNGAASVQRKQERALPRFEDTHFLILEGVSLMMMEIIFHLCDEDGCLQSGVQGILPVSSLSWDRGT